MSDPEPLSDDWWDQYRGVCLGVAVEVAAAALEWAADMMDNDPDDWDEALRLIRAKAREIREGV